LSIIFALRLTNIEQVVWFVALHHFCFFFQKKSFLHLRSKQAKKVIWSLKENGWLESFFSIKLLNWKAQKALL